MDIIKQSARKGDTLIHLGDVGDASYLDELKCYKVLITGNHDVMSKVAGHFDEVYDGPLFIADRILLSHEPIMGLEGFAINIHGHDHADTFRHHHINLASNVYKYRVFNLGTMIKNGLISQIENYHRLTIDNATEKKGRDSRKMVKIGIYDDSETLFIPGPFYSSENCRYCSNHPLNGGSGVCHCILGNNPIY